MQYIKQIVNAINNSIKANLTDNRFQNAEYYGIAVSAVHSVDGQTRLAPLVADNYDNEVWVGVDDTLPLRLYHKTNSITYSDEPAKGYGDDGNMVKKEVAQMSMIVYATRSMVRLTPEELEGAILSGLPSSLTNATIEPLKLRSCIIRPVSSALDPVSVYLNEYRTPQYELSPNALFIRVNYNIESTYKTSCFELCNC